MPSVCGGYSDSGKREFFSMSAKNLFDEKLSDFVVAIIASDSILVWEFLQNLLILEGDVTMFRGATNKALLELNADYDKTIGIML